MLQSNVQTIQDSVPSDLVKQTVRTIITTFLSRLSGTPVHKVEAALGPDRKMLPELALMDFLWSGDGAYFPAFRALYLLGDLPEHAIPEFLLFLEGFRDFGEIFVLLADGFPEGFYFVPDYHRRKIRAKPTASIVVLRFSSDFEGLGSPRNIIDLSVLEFEHFSEHPTRYPIRLLI
jgi:hypothetical protein